MNDYAELTYIRDTKVDGIGPWTWIKTDHGAWDGPKQDWETSHKHEYFKNVKNFDVVVQAGGCQGMYPRLLSEIFKVVYTFEPDPLNFYCLTQNCQKDNIVKQQAALGNHGGLIRVNRGTMENTGMHTVRPHGCVPQIQLDSIDFVKLDLLLLDVEGYEPNIIDGALRTIRYHKPVIICEMPCTQLQETLANLGYHLQGWTVSDAIFFIP